MTKLSQIKDRPSKYIKVTGGYKSKKKPLVTGKKKLITCDECKGFCCTHMAIPIEKPQDQDDYDDIKWYLYHELTSVFIGTDGEWYVQIEVKCKQLANDGKCKIYSKRPPTCRHYLVEECEKNVQDYTHFFGSIEDYEKYCEELGIELRY